jgi:AraC-like DNA-binding protein
MRQVIKNIHTYTNFNESQHVEVKKLSLKGFSVAGITCYKEAYNCGLFLEEPTITLVLEGEKYMLVNRKEYFLKPGDLLYIPRNTLVFTDIPKTKNSFRSFNLVLSEGIMRSLYGFQQGRKCSFNNNVLKVTQTPALIKDLRKIPGVFPLEEKKEEQIFLKLLNPIKKELFEPGTASEKRSSEEIINKVLLQSLYQPVNLSQMASLSYMSPATFKRRFKAMYGVSAKAWLRDQRLQAAYFHLKTNKEKVSDILTHLGFNNFSHFSYLFRKTFHTTPTSVTRKIEPISTTIAFAGE